VVVGLEVVGLDVVAGMEAVVVVGFCVVD